MKEFNAMTVNLYANQLVEPNRSFALNLTVNDFKKELFFAIKDALVVKYINPKGETFTLKEKYGRIK